MTPGQLKNSILQLAIKGKLVKQRKEEGTGEELYKEIQKEKQKLIEEGKLKKHKVLPKITEDEIPFDIPETWRWVRLRDICTKIVDGDHNPPAGIKTETNYWMLSATNINNGSLAELNRVRYLTKEGFEKENERTKVKQGDIFFTIVATLGRSCVYEGGYNICFQRSVSVITTLIYNYYLKYALDSGFIQQFMVANATGTAQKGFYLNQVEKLLIPIPPLTEQKRIVEKIEELLPLVNRYEKVWTRLEDLNKKFPLDMQKSILQEAIQGKLVEQRKEEGTGEELYKEIQKEKQKLIEEGKLKKHKVLPKITEDEIPFDIPETWKWVRLGEIGDWGSGATPSRTNADFYGGDIPWLKTGDLTDGYIYDVPECITKFALEKTSVRLNPKGSILIAMYGATIGKLGILTKAMTTNQACCACIVFPGVYNLYLFYFLLANRNGFIKQGEGGAQPNISKDKIINSLIPLPPLAEQRRIVEKIEELSIVCEKLKSLHMK